MERKFTGVALNKKEGKWRARYFRSDGQRAWVKDQFETAEEAARAYDAAVLKDGLPAQQLNFAVRDITGDAAKVATSLNSLQKRAAEVKAAAQPKPSSKKRSAPSPATEAAEKEPQDGFTKVQHKKPRRQKPDVHPPRHTTLMQKDAAKGKVDLNQWHQRIDAKADVADPWMRKVVGLVALCHERADFRRYFEPVIDKVEKDPSGWVKTHATKSENAGAEPQLFALDCEMVLCKPKGSSTKKVAQLQSTLARVSLVRCKILHEGTGSRAPQLKFETVVDEYVKTPEDLEVADYLTHVSGVTEVELSDAKLMQQEVRKAVAAEVGPRDIVVGHSLWADFGALQLWHGNLVDTSLLCAIKDLESITLSLKDAAEAVLQDKKELEEFQKSGEAHDSVADGQWAIRVMVRLLHLSETNKFDLPLTLEEIPRRYQARLTFHLLPVSVTDEDVAAFVEALMSSVKDTEANRSYEVKPVRHHERKDGSVTGSCVVEFAQPETAKRLFRLILPVSKGCGGYRSTPGCNAAGWPDRQGMIRKLVDIQDANQKVGHCEVISFFPTKLDYRRNMEIQAQHMGRLMGKMGRTVLMVQQVTGTRILVTRQPDRKSKVMRLAKTGEITLAADSQRKLDAAVQMVHKILKRELTLN